MSSGPSSESYSSLSSFFLSPEILEISMPTKKEETTTTSRRRRGVYTSEFALAVVVLVIAGIMTIANKGLSAQEWLDFAKWVVGGYAVSRGLAKVKL